MLITRDNIEQINKIPSVRKVVSLVPSLTETIAELGAREKIAGVTRFCKYPKGICQKKPVVGGPKNFDLTRILNLRPDVVVGVKEENDKEGIIQLSEKVPVLLFDIIAPGDAYTMIENLGQLLGREKQAKSMVKKIQNSLRGLPPKQPPRKCLYLIWKNPWMAAGDKTFIHQMLQLCGFKNVVEGRYPAIEEKHFREAEVILLSSEPFPFSDKHRVLLQNQYPGKKIHLVDGEMFSWYGSHMLQAGEYFRDLSARITQ